MLNGPTVKNVQEISFAISKLTAWSVLGRPRYFPTKMSKSPFNNLWPDKAISQKQEIAHKDQSRIFDFDHKKGLFTPNIATYIRMIGGGIKHRTFGKNAEGLGALNVHPLLNYQKSNRKIADWLLFFELPKTQPV